uniref:C4b-binding protein alpha chain-like n=1 Tax=Styela clava TaxID=7725 RepID=UPI00193A7075|nr:C4b-binding protein alpha chain-like [Styela clava]
MSRGRMKTLLTILTVLPILLFLQLCEANKPCEQPFIKNGFYKVSQRPIRGYFRDGVIISYSCDNGYYLEGETKSKCMNGHWSTQLPRCIKACESPNHIVYNHEAYGAKLYKVGSKIHFKCIDNYYIPSDVGYTSATCTEGGLWDQEPFSCYKHCEDPDKYIAGDFSPKKPQYKYEEIVYYGCPRSKTKYAYAHCETNGKWTQSKICLDYCKPRSISHGDYTPTYKAYKFNDKVVYKCNNGYYAHPHKDEHYSVCQKNGHWDKNVPVCRKYCEAPSHSTYYYNSFDKQLYKAGEKISFECQTGYYAPKHIEYDHATCLENGLWDQEPFTCYKYCSPHNIQNGGYIPVKPTFKYDQKLSYTCDHEYYLHYNGKTYENNVCQKDGSWNYQPPVCYKYCEAPLYSDFHYEMDFKKMLYKIGEEIQFICANGYYVPSNIDYESAVCGASGFWDQDPFVCYKYCPSYVLQHGILKPELKFHDYNTKLTYECSEDYYLYYEKDLYDHNICQTNGIWTYEHPVCKKSCIAPDSALYHYKPYEVTLYKYGEKIEFTCTDGYYAPSHIDYSYASCGNDGLWDQEPFKCYKYCHVPEHYAHGRIHPNKIAFKAGEKAVFSCSSGYRLNVNYNVVLCDKSGHWLKQLPQCIKHKVVKIVRNKH